ncbi:hypothetical protein LT85_3760 [Collimonas arenae]|uniref:FlxA-like family protein n=1 Tax=Collimonas arenae TaxID=279058 RepID=A0A0A1FDU1_9BURK|nr:FlxA-like family protein [Collimonas arenae]AIY42918.1 hypothetical protein LT85_3760 [Collimonas arenae]
MKINSAHAAAPSPANTASQIAALQKQLANLQKQLMTVLKEIPAPGEEELADMRVKGLQLQITSIEMEISRLSQMAAVPELSDTQQASIEDKLNDQPTQRQKHPTASAGGNVDLYV